MEHRTQQHIVWDDESNPNYKSHKLRIGVQMVFSYNHGDTPVKPVLPPGCSIRGKKGVKGKRLDKMEWIEFTVVDSNESENDAARRNVGW